MRLINSLILFFIYVHVYKCRLMSQIMGSEKRCNVILRSNDWLCDLFLNIRSEAISLMLIHNEFY